MIIIFNIIRKILNIIYYSAGGIAVFVGLWFLSIHNLWDGIMMLWVGAYLFYARKTVYFVKSNRVRFGKILHDILLAAIRGPVTALNIIMLFLIFFMRINIHDIVLVWLLLLAAWSVIPLNMLIDLLEKKICS